VQNLKLLLGRRIAELRRAAKLTQENLAEKTGYSVDFISLVERGVNAPSVEHLPDFAVALGVSLKDLFDFEELPRAVLRRRVRAKNGQRRK
jgi:transcriptional regulator with XRE-family HTH domain